MTDAGVQAVIKEPARLAMKLALEPGGKLAYRSVKSAVKWTIGHTRNALLSLPIIPAPVRKLGIGLPLEVAFKKDVPPSPPSVSSPFDSGGVKRP